jgi:hypothetical protein
VTNSFSKNILYHGVSKYVNQIKEEIDGNVARMGKIRNIYKVSSRKLEGERLLWRPCK